MQGASKRRKVEHALAAVLAPKDPWHVDCPFADAGCETWCSSDAKMRAHVRNSQLAHMRLVMARLAAVEAENKLAGTRIAELEERVEHLEEKDSWAAGILDELEWDQQDAAVATAKAERESRKRKQPASEAKAST